MSQPIVVREDIGPVTRLKLNNPSALNVLSDAMLDALQNQFDVIAEDQSVRAVILCGAGKAFCAGHDLKEMTAARKADDGGKAAFEKLFETCSKMMLTIRALPQPVIAQVHGIATAAGCQLVATCDMAVADETTRFGVNGVNIGLFCSTPMVALSRNISRKKAFEMLTTGAFISASQAMDAGLINRVTPEGSVEEATLELAQKVASKLGAVVKIGKEAYYKQLEMGLADAYAYTGNIMAENMLYRDTEEGIAAFIEKRAPDWDQ